MKTFNINKKTTRLIKIGCYAKTRFVQGSAPDKRTIISLIDRGQLAGKKIGNTYFVEVDSSNKEINDLGV